MSRGFFDKFLCLIGLGDENEEPEQTDDYPKWDKGGFSKPDKTKIVNLHRISNVKVMVIECKKFNDVMEICNNLKNRCPVITNLTKMNIEEAKRLIDFVSGAVYAIDGEIKKIGKGVFLLTPNNINVSGNITEEGKELENKNFISLANTEE
ncbi:MAG: cell division inhibitor SepF [Thermosediminibacterales bacterium]|nr:cell division inhibitor SepF [Thermosediminibacterales bacterium]MDK2836083.1 cell division inhibitor SepF [Thermosediminibacterales bacterium]